MQVSKRYLRSFATQCVWAVARRVCVSARDKKLVNRAAFWYRFSLYQFEMGETDELHPYETVLVKHPSLRLKVSIALLHLAALRPGVALFGVFAAFALPVFWVLIWFARLINVFI